MVPCGSLWFLVVPFGPLWFLVVPCGSLWFREAPCGSSRFLLVRCGSLWFAGVPCGSLELPVVSCGSLWFVVVPCGFLACCATLQPPHALREGFRLTSIVPRFQMDEPAEYDPVTHVDGLLFIARGKNCADCHIDLAYPPCECGHADRFHIQQCENILMTMPDIPYTTATHPYACFTDRMAVTLFLWCVLQQHGRVLPADLCSEILALAMDPIPEVMVGHCIPWRDEQERRHFESRLRLWEVQRLMHTMVPSLVEGASRLHNAGAALHKGQSTEDCLSAQF